MENIRWRGHKWQISVYINLFQKPQMNSFLTYHRETEGLAIGICIRKYWQDAQESPITVLSGKSVSLSHQYILRGGGGLIQFAQAIPEISFQTCGEKFPDPSRLCASLVVNHSRPVTALTYVQLLQICIYVEHGTWILGFFPLSVARYHLQEHLFKNKILGLQIQKFHGFFLREKRVCLCWTEIMVTLLREGDANRTQA